MRLRTITGFSTDTCWSSSSIHVSAEHNDGLGPLLRSTFLADIVIRSIGTDYARVVRAIYAFAQTTIRGQFATPFDAKTFSKAMLASLAKECNQVHEYRR